MKINLIESKENVKWTPIEGKEGGFKVDMSFKVVESTKQLNFVENFIVGDIKLSLYENETTYYLGYLQENNLYVGYDVNKGDERNKNFIQIIENLEPEPVANYFMERFGLELNTVILN